MTVNSDYDQWLAFAREAVTTALADLSSGEPKRTARDLAVRVDDLNRAWDELTDCLMRQRDVRDAEIRRLLDEIAELNKLRR